MKTFSLKVLASDKVFYDELVKAMNEAIIFDKDMTLETIRMEYL